MNKGFQLKKEIDNLLKCVNWDDTNDPYRLGFHLTPPVGLMNDPNGLIYFKGRYHVFFQWNPFETKHTFKSWGHYSSEDLIHWKLHPPALVPSEWYDKDGCYSGSAIEYDGKLFLFYTGNVREESGEKKSYQCLAISNDGISFEKKGPIIEVPPGYTRHFRDPKVWKIKDKWYMIIGAQSSSFEGLAVLFSSINLYDWQFEGPIAGSHISISKKFGYMWECPDFFTLSEKEILLVSPQGLEKQQYKYENLFQSGYFIGNWDMKMNKYTHGNFYELDQGFDFYAPQTFLDDKGRRLLIAWMGMGDEQEQNHLTIHNGWIHALTIPRELQLKNGQIYQQPVKELQKLRHSEWVSTFSVINTKKEIALHSQLQEIIIELERFTGKYLAIKVRNHCSIIFNQDEGILIVERKTFCGNSSEQRRTKIHQLKKIHLFLDRSSIEIFINDGQFVFSLRFFEEKENNSCVISSDGTVINWQSWNLHSFQFKTDTF